MHLHCSLVTEFDLWLYVQCFKADKVKKSFNREMASQNRNILFDVLLLMRVCKHNNDLAIKLRIRPVSLRQISRSKLKVLLLTFPYNT
jgi:hypothetical protein